MIFESTGLTIYACVIAAIFGAVMGSFFLCAVSRSAKGESFLAGRSYCDNCGKELGARDLFPIFSWILSKGKSRCCGQKLSALYPLSEFLCAAIFVTLLLKYGLTIEFVQYLVLACILFCIAFRDHLSYTIPNALVIAGIVWRIVMFPILAAINNTWSTITGDMLWSLISAVVLSVFVLVVALILEKLTGKPALGGGDVKLLFMLGLYFTWQIGLFGLLLSCIFGIVLAMVHKPNAQLEVGDETVPEGSIPFGVAISIAFWFVMLFGNTVFNWYLSFF